ncbi:MAG TPA: NAD-dependent epimerase/dehydratase family protein, partial [Candidatus Paceibacterota bacterium]|nr:NAD-dependent epimerase/dehydratase family protein [Candidatus Paceibacterota bacterium]
VVVDDLSTGRRENLNPKATFYQLDLADPEIENIMDREKPEIIFHFAFYVLVPKSALDPMLDFPVLEGSLRLLKKSRELGVQKFFLASSGFLYGNNPNLPVKETEPVDPVSAYVVSKRAIEQYLEFYKRMYGLPYVVLRYPAVYGPRQVTGAMADYIRKLSGGIQAEIWGDGTKTRDYIYIDDVVKANLLALDVPDDYVNPIFNLGTGIETTLNQVYFQAADILKKEAKPIYHPDRPGEQMRYALDSAKFKTELGWRPTVEFKDGLKRVIESWRNKPPLISAIITTYNRAEYCREAIKSILAQTFTDFELFVLDNSSKDNTEEVVKSFNDKRIRYIRHKQMNIAEARNLGWREARGRYVGFLDDDDRWLPNKLSSQLALFEKPGREPALVYGGFLKIDQHGVKIDEFRPILQGMILEELLKQKDAFTGSASNPLIRRDVLEKLGGYNETVATGEDWELYLRLAEKYTVEFTSEPVLEIRQHEGPRLGDKLAEAASLELMIMDQYKSIFNKDLKMKSFYFQKIGGKYFRMKERQKGRMYILKAIKANPFNILAYIQYLLSFLGYEAYRKIHAFQQKYFKNIIPKLLS